MSALAKCCGPTARGPGWHWHTVSPMPSRPPTGRTSPLPSRRRMPTSCSGCRHNPRWRCSSTGRSAPRPAMVRFKIFNLSKVALSDSLPVLENMGARVLDEHPYRIGPEAAGSTTSACRYPPMWNSHRSASVSKTCSCRSGVARSESDRLNQLVLRTHLDSGAITVLRAYTRYFKQLGFAFSQAYIENALHRNAALAEDICALFDARFDPGLAVDRVAAQNGIKARIDTRLARWRAWTMTASCASSMQRCSPPHAPTAGRPMRVVRPSPAWRSSSSRARCPASPSPSRCSRSGCIRPAWKVCTCAAARWRGAACAGPTGARTSAPRSWAWSRRSRSRTP
jgi:hypothetical protein